MTLNHEVIIIIRNKEIKTSKLRYIVALTKENWFIMKLRKSISKTTRIRERVGISIIIYLATGWCSCIVVQKDLYGLNIRVHLDYT